MVIVFSNGPDNASMVAPDDVRAVAEDEGIPIYVISTNEVNKDPISSGVFKRITRAPAARPTGPRPGRSRWKRSNRIREDLGNSYTVTYYPQANPNEGFRKISVEIVTTRARSTACAIGPATGLGADSKEPARNLSGGNRLGGIPAPPAPKVARVRRL